MDYHEEYEDDNDANDYIDQKPLVNQCKHAPRTTMKQRQNYINCQSNDNIYYCKREL